MHEKEVRRSHRNFHFRRHARRLVRGVLNWCRASRACLRFPCERLYPGSAREGLLADRLLVPAARIIWDKGRTVAGRRTHYWYQHEPCWYVRKKNAPWFGKAGENATIWQSPSPKFIMGGSDEAKFDHPTQKPVELMRRPILNHTRRGELVYDPFLGSGTTLAAAELTERFCLRPRTRS